MVLKMNLHPSHTKALYSPVDREHERNYPRLQCTPSSHPNSIQSHIPTSAWSHTSNRIRKSTNFLRSLLRIPHSKFTVPLFHTKDSNDIRCKGMPTHLYHFLNLDPLFLFPTVNPYTPVFTCNNDVRGILTSFKINDPTTDFNDLTFSIPSHVSQWK